MNRLPGKTPLITGAARGIGCAFAERDMAEGAHMAFADIGLDRTRATAARLGTNSLSLPLHGTGQASIDAPVTETVRNEAEVGVAAPNGRLEAAEDLTGMAVFLASDDARYIVSQTNNLDGGNWMS